jgi:hypothetical protein
MTLIPIANEDLILAHGAGSPISGGSFAIVSVPSPDVYAEGKKVYTDPLEFTFAGGDASGFLTGSVATTAPIEMPATAIKKKAIDSESSLELVMREGDSVVMECVGTFDPPASPPTGPVLGAVEIATAGQSKWKAQ